MVDSFRAADAGHDHPLLSGMVPDAADRSASVPGVNILHFQLLPRLAERTFPRTLATTFLYLPFLMSLGIGLTVTNTSAVMEALLGIKSAFKRTPKYRVESKKDKVLADKVSPPSRHCSLDRTR